MPKLDQKGVIHLLPILLVVAVLLVAGFFILQKFQSQGGKKEASVSLQTQYKNPFDKSAQYVNPFAQYKNPFDALKITKAK